VDGLTRLLEEDTSRRGYGSRDANVRHPNSSYAINVMVLQSTESRWRSFIDHVESEYRIFVRTPPKKLISITQTGTNFVA